MNIIEARGLCKNFGNTSAVVNFDMHVKKGDIYGFIGRNGAGKSTVMKMACGLVTPTSGDISVFDSGVQEKSSFQKIGVLIENPGLYPHMNAYDNLMQLALCNGVVDPKNKIRTLLELVGLSDLKKSTGKFSMGMKQRLGLAMALINNPDLLLLDEPLNGLDPEGAREIRQLILKLNEEQGITVLISSHIIAHLGKVASCYGVIRKGSMVREVSGEEVRQECSDYLSLKASDPSQALVLLQEACPSASFSAMPDGSLRIQGLSDAAFVGDLLNQNNISVHGLYTHRLDLEEYFVRLMGDD